MASKFRLFSRPFSAARKWDENASVRADMERLRLHSFNLDAKAGYETYLVSAVATAVVSGAISIPVVYMFGKFLDYKFPVIEEEEEETVGRHGMVSSHAA